MWIVGIKNPIRILKRIESSLILVGNFKCCFSFGFFFFVFRCVKVNISLDMWNTLIISVLYPISNGLSYDKFVFSMLKP